MKSLLFVLVMLSMVTVSCKSSSGSVNGNKDMEQVGKRPMGLWSPMEWTSDCKIEKKGADLIVSLPAGKTSAELKCSNYKGFWLSSVNEEPLGPKSNLGYEGEFFSILCKDNLLKVTVDQNTVAERSFDVLVQSGDVFCRIKFVQKKK